MNLGENKAIIFIGDKAMNRIIRISKKYITAFFYWLGIGIVTGAVCGVVGAAFAKAIDVVTDLRHETSWLLYLLPIGGVAIVWLYKLCRVTDIGTNHVFESVRSEKPVSPLLAPAIFIGSVITHMFGGSAGREGAALQLGGSISTALAKVFRLNEKARHVLTMCGMGALFSALFGTPLGACVFAIEVVSVGRFCSAAVFPGLVASITAYGVSVMLGTTPERFIPSAVPELALMPLLKVVAIAIVGAVVSVIFCKAMHFACEKLKQIFKNGFLRAAVGGVAVILLTLAVNTTDYNGGGIHVIARIFQTGEVSNVAFIMKIIFTAITIGAGFKGGEIVPTMFIGATMGGALATFIGLNPGFGAAVGISALLCGVTNCPLATILLSIELFGSQGMIFYALSAAVSFLLSGYASLYTGQSFAFSKLTDDKAGTDNI